MIAEHYLASYGTLAPGEENNHQLDGLRGTWQQGKVRGKRVQAGSGIWNGFPGFIPDPNGKEIAVHIFQSLDLPKHWPRLDAFEGDDYKRIETTAKTDNGFIKVSIYTIKPSGKPIHEA